MRTLLILTAVTAFGPAALAADTIETFDAGASDVELYSAVDGVGRGQQDQALGGEMVMGWGLARNLSAYLATSLEADGTLTGAETGLNLGVFGTPVDTDHLDVDLLLDLRVGGDGLREAMVVPAVEVNLDRQPDLAAHGVFARAAAEIAGSQDRERPGRHVDLGLTVGGYWSLHPRHQLLVEYDATVHDDPDPGTPAVEAGGVALGFNSLLSPALELITEVKLDVPEATLGVMAGLIATLP